MADIYTDITNGNDTTGDGSVATPYATIQKAIDNANGGDVIWIGDSATNTLSSQLNWTTFGSVQDTSADNRLVIRGWDYSAGAGVDGLATISGGGTLGSPFAATKNYITLYHLTFDDYTTEGIDVGAYCILYECKVTNIDAGYAITTATNYVKVIGCMLDTIYRGINLSAGLQSVIMGCSIISYASDWAISSGGDSMILNNIIASAGGSGIRLNVDGVLVLQNTIIGDGATSTKYGIEITANSERTQLIGNLIKGWSATGNVGIYNQANNNIAICGYNHFDGNTTNMSNVTDNLDVDLTSHDATSAVTFTNAAGGDYSIDTGDTGYDAPFYGISTQQYMDTGAAQRANTGGGLLVNPGMSGGMRG